MVRKWAKFKGHLGWRKDMPQAERRALLEAKVKRDGYATVIRKLLQLANVTKDIGTKLKARADMEHLRKKFRPALRPKGRGC
jgi:hypothetical protein